MGGREEGAWESVIDAEKGRGGTKPKKKKVWWEEKRREERASDSFLHMRPTEEEKS